MRQQRTDGATALAHGSLQRGHLEIVHSLLGAGADKEAATPWMGQRLCWWQPSEESLGNCAAHCWRLELTKMQQKQICMGDRF